MDVGNVVAQQLSTDVVGHAGANLERRRTRSDPDLEDHRLVYAPKAIAEAYEVQTIPIDAVVENRDNIAVESALWIHHEISDAVPTDGIDFLQDAMLIREVGLPFQLVLAPADQTRMARQPLVSTPLARP